MSSDLTLADLDPRNILALASLAVRDAVARTYAEYPEYQNMQEYDLENVIHPSINASLIRTAFWEEYKRAQDSGGKNMMMSRVYDGVMTKDAFYKFLENSKNVAWMMCPPADEFLQMRADNYKARQEFSKILRTPLIDHKGNVKMSEAKLSLQIYKMYADRIHGAVIQRIEQKTQNIPANDIGGDPDEIRKKIRDLEALQVNEQPVIDVKGESGNE